MLDPRQVRVHYKRFNSNYAAWGLRLWVSSELDAARMPGDVAIDQWGNAVGFDHMPAYATAPPARWCSTSPCTTPRAIRAACSSNSSFTANRPMRTKKTAAMTMSECATHSSVSNHTGEIWGQGAPSIYYSPPDLRRVSTTDARAFVLNRDLIQWQANDGSDVIKLYRAANAQMVVVKGAPAI